MQRLLSSTRWDADELRRPTRTSPPGGARTGPTVEWPTGEPSPARRRYPVASVAEEAGDGALGGVLSGSLEDGSVGSALIARAGGRIVVEDPLTAEFPGMPSAALTAAPNAALLGSQEPAASVLAALAKITATSTTPPPPQEREQIAMTQGTSPDHSSRDRPSGDGDDESMAVAADLWYLSSDESRLTRMTCPECGGALAAVDLPRITYFRCHVGHQYGPQSLAAAQAETAESKLWAAIAALDEQAALEGHLSRRSGAPDIDVAAGGTSPEAYAQRASSQRELVRRWGTDNSSEPRRRPTRRFPTRTRKLAVPGGLDARWTVLRPGDKIATPACGGT